MDKLLTVIIPTIGRKSIEDSLKSIDYPAKIVVATDIECENFKDISESAKKYGARLILTGEHGAGNVKNNAIELVDTPYFIILDDDDQFIPEFLNTAMYFMLFNVKIGWFSTHWKEGITELMSSSAALVKPDSFLNRYFDFDDYSNQKNYIYPNSSILWKTELYQEYIRNGGYRFQGNTQDDVLICTDFMSKYMGFNHFGYGFIVGKDPESVSRKEVNLSDENKNLIDELVRRSISGNEDAKLWRKVMYNILAIWNYTKIK